MPSQKLAWRGPTARTRWRRSPTTISFYTAETHAGGDADDERDHDRHRPQAGIGPAASRGSARSRLLWMRTESPRSPCSTPLAQYQ